MEKCVGVEVLGRKLIVNENGDVWGVKANGDLKLIPNVASNHTGYNVIQCKKKLFRHRLIGYTYLGLDIENSKQCIDHIDGNILNNSKKNLRIVTHQQNNFNRVRAKGYTKHSKNSWKAKITLNSKDIYLGSYATESEAHTVFLKAKLIYHKII